MIIHVRMFAILRERTGISQCDLDLPSGADVAAALAAVERRFASVRELLPKTATAVNMSYVKPDEPLQNGDELALIPPVSGG